MKNIVTLTLAVVATTLFVPVVEAAGLFGRITRARSAECATVDSCSQPKRTMRTVRTVRLQSPCVVQSVSVPVAAETSACPCAERTNTFSVRSVVDPVIQPVKKVLQRVCGQNECVLVEVEVQSNVETPQNAPEIVSPPSPEEVAVPVEAAPELPPAPAPVEAPTPAVFYQTLPGDQEATKVVQAVYIAK